MNRACVSSGTASGGLIYVQLEYPKEEMWGGSDRKDTIFKIRKRPKFDENYELRNINELQALEYEENSTKSHHNQVAQN